MLPRTPTSTLFPYTTLFRSLYDRDAYQSWLRQNTNEVSGLRFAVQWKSSHGEAQRSEEHTSELQSHSELVCRPLLEKRKTTTRTGGSSRLPPADSVSTSRQL